MNLSTRKLLPTLLIILGVFIVAAAAFLSIRPALFRPGVISLPNTVAGIPLVQSLQGQAALDNLEELHGRSFLLNSGAVGYYGDRGEVILWVSGTLFDWTAGRMVAEMSNRIGEGDSIFNPVGTLEDGRRTVYLVETPGQLHFYFQSGSRLVWLAASPSVAEQALQQVLQYYPNQD